MNASQSKIKALPQRRPTNVSLNRDLVEQARELGINLSQACERGIIEQLAQTRAEQWADESRAALASSNAFVEARGLPLVGKRQF